MSKQAKKTGLGKGFGSLLPEEFDSSVLLDKKDRIQKVKLSQIKPDPSQPRKHFDEEKLAELSASIKNYGVLQPLVVMPEGDDFIIIAGERRYRAAKLAGLDTVPVLARTHEELERLEIGLVENVQREDLSPLEQAQSIAKLNAQFSLSYEEIGKRLGKAHTTIVNIVRLLKLPEAASKALSDKKISEGHARSILALSGDEKLQNELLKNIIENGWSVRRAEQFVKDHKAKKLPKDAKANKQNPEKIYTEQINELTQKLGRKVLVKNSKTGNEIRIPFKTKKDLEDILGKLN